MPRNLPLVPWVCPVAWKLTFSWPPSPNQETAQRQARFSSSPIGEARRQSLSCSFGSSRAVSGRSRLAHTSGGRDAISQAMFSCGIRATRRPARQAGFGVCGCPELVREGGAPWRLKAARSTAPSRNRRARPGLRSVSDNLLLQPKPQSSAHSTALHPHALPPGSACACFLFICSSHGLAEAHLGTPWCRVLGHPCPLSEINRPAALDWPRESQPLHSAHSLRSYM